MYPTRKKSYQYFFVISKNVKRERERERENNKSQILLILQ